MTPDEGNRSNMVPKYEFRSIKSSCTGTSSYAMGAFRKVRRESNFARLDCTHGQLYTKAQSSSDEIQIPAHWNMIS